MAPISIYITPTAYSCHSGQRVSESSEKYLWLSCWWQKYKADVLYFVDTIKPSFKITQGIQRADRWGILPLKTYLMYLYIYTYCSYIYMYRLFSAMKKDW